MSKFHTLQDRQSAFRHFVTQNCGSITDKAVEGLTELGYFTAPASTKYHGSYEGGLFDHSLNVAQALVTLTERNQLRWIKGRRSPCIVGMFHDLCKCDQYERLEFPEFLAEYEPDKHYKYRENTLLKGHGDKSVMLLSQFIRLTEEEILCIRYHMGAFTDESEWQDYTRAIHKYPNVLWTHTADMIATHIMEVDN